jgi:hypothetical protein
MGGFLATGFSTNILQAFPFSPIHATCPVHLILLDLIILIIWPRTKFLIMKFSQTSFHFISFRAKYSPQHPVLKQYQSIFLP